MLWVPCDDCHRPVPRLRRPRSSHLPDHGRPRLPRRDIVTLPSCGSEFWSAGPRPTAAAHPDQSSAPDRDASEYWEEYKFELYADVAVRQAYEERYARMLALLLSLDLRPKSLLDMGGGIGNFALWGAERGLRAIMTDVDAGAVAEARARGVEAVLPDDLAGLLPAGGVDLVTLWDVIEHTSEPAILLEQACAALAPGGALFFETPDARFPLRKGTLGMHRATGGRVDRTGALYYWEHKVYFTESGLRRLLDRHGMRTVAVQRWTSPRAKMTKLLADPGSGCPPSIAASGGSTPMPTRSSSVWPSATSSSRSPCPIRDATEPPHHERVCGAVSVKVRPS